MLQLGRCRAESERVRRESYLRVLTIRSYFPLPGERDREREKERLLALVLVGSCITFVLEAELVVIDVSPLCWAVDAQHALAGQLLPNPLSPDDQQEEDEHAVQAIKGVDDDPDPGRGRVVVERVREHLENPREAAEQKKSEVQDASEG